jgi:hypothetical protein
MSIARRLKAQVSTREYTPVTALPFTVPDDASILKLSGAVTIPSMVVNRDDWGKRYLDVYSATGSIVLTNNAGSTTAGQFDVGTGDLTLGATDMVRLFVRDDGVLVRASAGDN